MIHGQAYSCNFFFSPDIFTIKLEKIPRSGCRSNAILDKNLLTFENQCQYLLKMGAPFQIYETQ